MGPSFISAWLGSSQVVRRLGDWQEVCRGSHGAGAWRRWSEDQIWDCCPERNKEFPRCSKNFCVRIMINEVCGWGRWRGTGTPWVHIQGRKNCCEGGSIVRSSPAYSGPFCLAYTVKYIQPTSSICPAYSVISCSLLIQNVEVDPAYIFHSNYKIRGLGHVKSLYTHTYYQYFPYI